MTQTITEFYYASNYELKPISHTEPYHRNPRRIISQLHLILNACFPVITALWRHSHRNHRKRGFYMKKIHFPPPGEHDYYYYLPSTRDNERECTSRTALFKEVFCVLRITGVGPVGLHHNITFHQQKSRRLCISKGAGDATSSLTTHCIQPN